MAQLRQRMLDDLRLRGYSERTCQAYLAAVRQFAAHYRKSPEMLSEDDVRGYFLHLTHVKRHARGSVTIAICGLKFFFERTFRRKWDVFDLARPPREEKLPVVLSREEAGRILNEVRIDVYRVCLVTIYACGLRLMEGARIQIPDIDGRRGMLRVRGKGNKDRCVPIQNASLDMLRSHWRTHRSSLWLFPASARRGLQHSLATNAGPVTRSSLQSAFRRALQKTGIPKRAHVHTLRHSYAGRSSESAAMILSLPGFILPELGLACRRPLRAGRASGCDRRLRLAATPDGPRTRISVHPKRPAPHSPPSEANHRREP